MTGKVGDLTTLATVKGWSNPTIVGGTDDPQLQREITACSKFLINYLQRSLITVSYTEIRNGNGQSQLKLKRRPIISVSSVLIDNVQVPACSPTDQRSYGYTFDPNDNDPVACDSMLYLRGYNLCRGLQNVQIQYVAGLLTVKEPQQVQSNSIKCSALAQLWASDWAVYYANTGVQLTATPAGTAPNAGQYTAPQGPDDQYSFNAADSGANLLVSYSWTPKDIEAACVSMIILEYNRRKRYGVQAENLAGENVNYYTPQSMTPSIRDMLNSYREVVPVLT